MCNVGDRIVTRMLIDEYRDFCLERYGASNTLPITGQLAMEFKEWFWDYLSGDLTEEEIGSIPGLRMVVDQMSMSDVEIQSAHLQGQDIDEARIFEIQKLMAEDDYYRMHSRYSLNYWVNDEAIEEQQEKMRGTRGNSSA